MLTDDQIALVRKMCRIPASGSPIVIGVWAEDTNANIQAIMGPDIKYRDLGAQAAMATDDKAITVLRDFWPEHEATWLRNLDALRFRNQLIIMLDPDQPYGARFLSRIALVGDRPAPEKPIKPIRTYTTMTTNHTDARQFVNDIEAKCGLMAYSNTSLAGLKTITFLDAEGNTDDRYEVVFLLQDSAMINIILGEI